MSYMLKLDENGWDVMVVGDVGYNLRVVDLEED